MRSETLKLSGESPSPVIEGHELPVQIVMQQDMVPEKAIEFALRLMDNQIVEVR